MAKVKLTDQIIYEIYNAEGSLKEIAKKYGVSESTVRRIKKLEYKKYADAIARVSGQKIKESEKAIKAQVPQKIDNPKERIKEKIKNLTKEMLIGDLFAILEKYFTPIIIKCLYDNVLKTEQFDQLLENTVIKIKESGDPEFYIEAIRTILLGLLLQVLKEEQIPKILKD